MIYFTIRCTQSRVCTLSDISSHTFLIQMGPLTHAKCYKQWLCCIGPVWNGLVWSVRAVCWLLCTIIDFNKNRYLNMFTAAFLCLCPNLVAAHILREFPQKTFYATSNCINIGNRPSVSQLLSGWIKIDAASHLISQTSCWNDILYLDRRSTNPWNSLFLAISTPSHSFFFFFFFSLSLPPRDFCVWVFLLNILYATWRAESIIKKEACVNIIKAFWVVTDIDVGLLTYLFNCGKCCTVKCLMQSSVHVWTRKCVPACVSDFVFGVCVSSFCLCLGLLSDTEVQTPEA